MLDMFKRPTDPPEYNSLYALSAAALLATYAAGHFAGECGQLIAVSTLQLKVLCLGEGASLHTGGCGAACPAWWPNTRFLTSPLDLSDHVRPQATARWRA